MQTVEYEMIRDLATDKAKREMFDRLAQHFKVLAGETGARDHEAKAKSGLTSAPRLPQPEQMKLASMPKSRTSSSHQSAVPISPPATRFAFTSRRAGPSRLPMR